MFRPTSPRDGGGMEIQHVAAQKQKFLRHREFFLVYMATK